MSEISVKATMNNMKRCSSGSCQSHLDGKGLALFHQQRFQRWASLLPDGSTFCCAAWKTAGGLSLVRRPFGERRRRWQIDREPTLMPNAELYPRRYGGIEIHVFTYVPELKKFAVSYTLILAVVPVCLWLSQRIFGASKDLVHHGARR